MAYSGYLIKFGNDRLPFKYMSTETYKSYPDQRMEASAERVSTGKLHRQTCSHTATKVEWETPPMWSTDMDQLTALFDSHWANEQERKIQVTYYDTWKHAYKTGTFYMPDPEMTILRVDNVHNRILYGAMRIALIEY